MQLHKGQIVRKCLNDGTPIGPYMLILKVNRNGSVLLQSLISPDIQVLYGRNNLKIISVRKLVIPDTLYQKVESEKQSDIIHESTPMWERMCKEDPELVRFSSFSYSDKYMLWKVDKVIRKYDIRYGFEIRLYLGEKVL